MIGKRPVDRRAGDVDRRRRQVVAGSAVTGAALLGTSLSSKPGSARFYAVSSGVAAVWLVGGLRSGPLRLGWDHSRPDNVRRLVIAPVTIGAAAFGVFYGGAQIARRIPTLSAAISSVMRYAHEGSGPLVMLTALTNGASEEVFFRGALFAAVDGRHAVSVSTAVYTLAATATRNPALVLASAAMGALFGRQRRLTGGIQAPILTHLTWSTLMLRFLPRLFPPRG
jgi:uncharacterized protein